MLQNLAQTFIQPTYPLDRQPDLSIIECPYPAGCSSYVAKNLTRIENYGDGLSGRIIQSSFQLAEEPFQAEQDLATQDFIGFSPLVLNHKMQAIGLPEGTFSPIFFFYLFEHLIHLRPELQFQGSP